MPGNIIFDEIPVDWRQPGTYLEVKPNYSETGLLDYPVKNLIIGQKLGDGTLKEGDIVEIVNPDDAMTLFGRGSIGAAQVKAFRKANKTQPLFVMALPDHPDAVEATGNISFTGTVNAAIVLRFKIAGQQIRITAPASAEVAVLATKLAAAINEDIDLPVTATASAGTVKIISRHKGEVGNEIDLRVDTAAQPLPNGLTVTVNDMAGGSGNPDINEALDVIASSWYTGITHPWNDFTNMRAFADFVGEGYKAMAKRDVQGFVAKRATFAEASEWGRITNSPWITCLVLDRSPSPSWVLAASTMGVAWFHLANDPSRQLKSLVLPGVEAPDAAKHFIETERDLLLRRGVSSLDYLADGSVTISRLITTYQVSNMGVADKAWLDIMTPATMSRVRYDWSGYIGLLYPRAKLTRDNNAAATQVKFNDDGNYDNSIVTPRIMKAVWAGRCKRYEEQGWIDDIQTTLKQSFFQIAENDKNRLESKQIVDIVGNLMVLAGSLEFKART